MKYLKRMSRAKWKGPFLPDNILDNSLKKHQDIKTEIFTKVRSTVIIPQFVGLTINVHNGKLFSKIKITDKMLGHKLGEFSPTRKKFSYKKKKDN